MTLAPPIVVRDELDSGVLDSGVLDSGVLDSGVLIEHCRIPQLTESFYAIIQNRRFPNQLLGDLLTRYAGAQTSSVAF